MADLDVSDLLLDPIFVDPLTLIHRTTAPNGFGENIITEVMVNTVGSVQPANFKQIQRLPEALRNSDIRSFFIKAEIKVDGTGTYPDIILFKGYRYEIKTAAPWLNFGGGWNEGVCVRQDPAA